MRRLLLSLLFSSGLANAALTDGLIMRLPLNEGSGTTITDAAGIWTCTASDASWDDDATYGDVYLSSQSNNINCGDQAFGGAEMTIAFWVFPDSFPVVENIILEKYVPTGDNRSMRLIITNGGLLRLIVTDDGTSAGLETQNASASIDIGEWTHVIVTFDSGVFDVYVNNGSAVSDDGDFSTLTSIADNASTLYVGDNVNAGGVSNGLIGSLREFAIWNRILTTQERTDAFNDAWAAAPVFTSSPTLDDCTDTACTFDYTADAAGDTIYGMLTDTAASAPTCDAIEATTGTHGDNSDTTTGSADTLILTSADTPEFPLYDAHFCLEDSGGNDSAVVTVSDNTLDAPTGFAFSPALTSIGTGSPVEEFNNAVTPDVAVGDYLLYPDSMSPGGSPPEDFDLTFDAAGQFSYVGDGTQQSAGPIYIYDTSLGAWYETDCTDKFTDECIWIVDQNHAPVNILNFDPIILPEDIAAEDINVCDAFVDEDGDDLTAEFTGTEPPGMALSGLNNCIFGGTATTKDVTVGTTLTFTVTDEWGETAEIDATFFVGNEVTMPDVVGGDLDNANTEFQATFLWIEELSYSVTITCHDTAAENIVYDQNPDASTEVDPFPDISVFVSNGNTCPLPGQLSRKKLGFGLGVDR